MLIVSRCFSPPLCLFARAFRHCRVDQVNHQHSPPPPSPSPLRALASVEKKLYKGGHNRRSIFQRMGEEFRERRQCVCLALSPSLSRAHTHPPARSSPLLSSSRTTFPRAAGRAQSSRRQSARIIRASSQRKAFRASLTPSPCTKPLYLCLLPRDMRS